MASGGFKVNKQGIRRMMREIQREMDKHPVTAKVESDTSGVSFGGNNIFNGPVIHGDVNGAQLAWGNAVAHQTQSQQQIAPGFEAIAQAVVDALRELPAMGVSEEDLEDAATAGEEVLNEVVQAEPDRGRIRRAVAALKGYFAPIATGAVTAAAAAGSEESARTVIERLSAAL
ncbi:hypothetical protein [Streptomyces rimosus]|uniref:hypothetical protein n=1 Tax=Streptomyces rimosus TaxID=1927 RepID=UPI0004CA2BF2|nr:hypothetical protein [Streptomyces rimosus]